MVCGVVLVRTSQNKLIWFSDAVLLFVVEWTKALGTRLVECRQNIVFLHRLLACVSNGLNLKDAILVIVAL